MKRIVSYMFLMSFAFGVANTVLPTHNVALEPIEINADDSRVSLYPNPATSFTQIKINTKEAKVAEVAIYSLLGNQIFAKAYSEESNIQLNVQNYRKGKYLVKVTFTDGSSEVKALIKQ